MTKLKTFAEARAGFDERGESIAAWAREHGFSRSLVYMVLAGRKKCIRGDSHKIAVLLGMKHGVVVRPPPRPKRAAPPTSQQRRAA